MKEELLKIFSDKMLKDFSKIIPSNLRKNLEKISLT